MMNKPKHLTLRIILFAGLVLIIILSLIFSIFLPPRAAVSTGTEAVIFTLHTGQPFRDFPPAWQVVYTEPTPLS